MDSATQKVIFDVGNRFIDEAFKQSPSDGNGYGYLVAVLFLLLVCTSIMFWIERRDGKKYRAEQDERNLKLWNAGEAVRKSRADKFEERVSASNKEIQAFFGKCIDELGARDDIAKEDIEHLAYSLRRLEEKAGLPPIPRK